MRFGAMLMLSPLRMSALCTVIFVVYTVYRAVNVLSHFAEVNDYASQPRTYQLRHSTAAFAMPAPRAKAAGNLVTPSSVEKGEGNALKVVAGEGGGADDGSSSCGSWCLPDTCDTETHSFSAEMRAYAVWREGKMAFLRAAGGDVAEARLLQQASGDGDPPLSLSVYGNEGGGWGDRLPAVVSLFAFAVRYRRIFFWNYPAVYPWVTSPFFDWRVDNATLPKLVADLSRTRPQFLYSCEAENNKAAQSNASLSKVCLFFNVAPELRYPDAETISPYMVSNRGLWSAGSLRNHTAFFDELTRNQPGCLHQALVRPRSALLALPQVRKGLAAFSAARATGKRVIGMHYRASDAVMVSEALRKWVTAGLNATTNSSSTPALTFEQASAIVNGLVLIEGAEKHFLAGRIAYHIGRADEAIFFATNSLELRASLAIVHPTIILSGTTPVHIGNDNSDVTAAAAHKLGRGVESGSYYLTTESTTVGHVIADWWLLARTDVRIGSHRSGFMMAATLHSKYAAFDIEATCNAQYQCCINANHAILGKCFGFIVPGM